MLTTQYRTFNPSITTSTVQRLAIIDAGVKDYPILAAGVRSDITVEILHPAEDGIEQITQLLQKYSQLQELHILSHGSPGCLYLGNSILNSATLEVYAAELEKWSKSLDQNAEILLYGCDVAATPSLAIFLTQLQQLTGAKIAASRSKVGNQTKGGNWDLEVQIGVLLASPALTPAAQLAYDGVLAAGDLDPTFGTGGKVINPAAVGSSATDLVIQPDGKMVIISTQSSTSIDARDFILTRYNSDGSSDNTFGVGGKVIADLGEFDFLNTVFDPLALQSDSKILIAGGVDGDVGLARYNSNGTLDTSFDGDGKIIADFGFSEGRDIAVQPDGKIVVAVGFFDPLLHPSGNLVPMPGEALIQDFTLVRYNSDGSLDTSFGTLGKATTDFGELSSITNIVLQPDGKIVAFGSAAADFALARYNNDGSLDTSFGNAGKVTTDIDFDDAGTITLQPDGKIVIGGAIRDTNNGRTSDIALVRYNSDGSLDSNFGTNGILTQNFGDLEIITDAEVQGDGKIVAVVASFDPLEGDFIVTRYNSNGSPDTSFGTNGIVTTDFDFGISSALAIQADNKIVAAGPAAFGLGIARYDAGDVIAPEPTPDPTPEPTPTPDPTPEPVPEPTPTPPLPPSILPDGVDPNFEASQLVVNPPVFPQPNPTVDTRTGSVIFGDDNANTLDGQAESQVTIFANAGSDNLFGSPGNDRLYANSGKDYIIAGEGDDEVFAGQDNDAVQGNGGNDSISGNLGNDYILGNSGDDRIYGNAGIDYIHAGEGNDTAYGGQDNDGITGGKGDDELLGNLGNDALDGQLGNDRLFGNAGADVILGGGDADVLYGGQDNDGLNGGDGGDILLGESGSDTLIGGAGGDRFDFSAGDGSDIITDFQDGVDIIGLKEGLTFEALAIEQLGSTTQIRIGTNSLVSLLNVNLSAISADDFALV